MRRTFLFASMLALLATAGSAHAQAGRRSSDITISRGSFAIAPFGGYLLSQRFMDGPLGTSLDVVSSSVYGVQASLPLAPSASIIGSIGHGSGDLEAGLPIIGGISVGTTSTTLFDASVELRFERKAARFIPLVQLGGGAIRREVTVAGMSASTTDFQVSGALGADFPLASNIALRVLAKDHYGKADFGSIGSLDARTDDLHAVALTGGLRIAF
ncbi:MAG: outer membrane beta-barrel protein [Gemmatimonadota bacterium]